MPQTTPLRKAITTLEGQLVAAGDVVAIVASAVDPSQLPPKWAALAVAIQHVGLAVSRGYVKGQSYWPAAAATVEADADDLGAAWHAIEHGDPEATAAALEDVAASVPESGTPAGPEHPEA